MIFRGCTAAVKPAERVLQRQEPQGAFFTSVELKHLKYKCLSARRRAFLSSAERYRGARPEGPCRDLLDKNVIENEKATCSPASCLENKNQKGAAKFALRLEDVPRTGRVFSRFC